MANLTQSERILRHMKDYGSIDPMVAIREYGCMRLARFAHRLMELIQEYYDDPEVGEVHLKQRLEQLGFLMQDGHMIAIEGMDGAVNAQRYLSGSLANPEQKREDSDE